MAFAIPVAIAAIQGIQKQQSDAYNSEVAGNEAKSASQQSLVAESLQRRQGRESLGRTAAAIAQSGVGPGSSTGVMDQAAVNAEMDALTARYKGQFTAYGYKTQSGNLMREGRMAIANAGLNAGAQYLKGTTGGYTGIDLGS